MANYYGIGENIGGLFNQQANQSVSAGNVAANLADPFKNERGAYQNSLRSLMANPGEFSSSPVYKFAYDQGLNALQRKGNVRSGNKLAELMKYGQGMASQMYFPQANLLSTLSGATTGSPAAAGIAYSGGFNRSQDQRQAGMAANAYGSGGMSGGSSSLPWWMTVPDNPGVNTPLSQQASTGMSGSGGYYTPQTYMPSGGYGGYDAGYGGDYDPYGLSGYSDYGDQYLDDWQFAQDAGYEEW